MKSYVLQNYTLNS